MKRIVLLFLTLLTGLTVLSSCGSKETYAGQYFAYTGEVTLAESAQESTPDDQPEIEQNYVRIVFNGEQIRIEHPLTFIDNVLYADVEDFAELFDAKVSYTRNGSLSYIFIANSERTLIFRRDKNEPFKSGESVFTYVRFSYYDAFALPLEGEIKFNASTDRCYIPAKNIADGFGYNSKYYEDTNVFSVNLPQQAVPQN